MQGSVNLANLGLLEFRLVREMGAGQSTRADCWEWYGESQGEPIPIALAKTFVDVVVAKAALDSQTESQKPRC